VNQGFRADLEPKGKGIFVIRLRGYLDAYTAPQLDTLIAGLLEQNSNRIIVDCAELDYISSAGLGVFMAYIEPTRAAGGDLKFCSLNERIAMIMDMLGFQHIFHITEHFDQALRAFETPSD
jgi:anti-sigma B factor antagonist